MDGTVLLSCGGVAASPTAKAPALEPASRRNEGVALRCAEEILKDEAAGAGARPRSSRRPGRGRGTQPSPRLLPLHPPGGE